MLKNYIRTALRVIARHPGYASINIFGLSGGVAIALLLLTFVSKETSYDTFHSAAERTYRAWVLEDYGEDQQFFNTTTPLPLAATLSEGIPEIEHAVRYDRINDTITRGSIRFNESLYMVDPGFFDVFDFKMVKGVPAQPFEGPESIILSESAVERYFGDSDPIGEDLTIEFNGDPRSYTVSAVYEDVPSNSSLQWEFLLPYSVADWLYSARMHSAWFNVSPETYITLRVGADVNAVEAKMPSVLANALGDRVEPGQYTAGLQPLTGIHLDPSFPIGYAAVSNPVYVKVLLSVALLVLLIACINFVTLSLSRASTRSREIGVRKAIGADRSQLARQYFGEAVVFTALAVGLGLLLAFLLVPGFNSLSQDEIALTFGAQTWLMIGSLFLAISLVIGIYPAVVMSSFSPTEAFRGTTSTGSQRGLLRKSLVTVQFALSIMLLISMLTMSSQLKYVQTKDLGFNPDHVLYVPTEISQDEAQTLADRIRFEVADRSDIESISTSMLLFDTAGWGRIGYNASDGTYKRFFANVVDHNFQETMHLRLNEGRFFDQDKPSDATRAIVINQAFADAYGWTDPLAERIPGEFNEHEIIGVVENFNYSSLHSQIQPAAMSMSQGLIFSGASDFDYQGNIIPRIAFRVSGNNVPATIEYLESVWEAAAGGLPFSYQFVDQDLASQYIQESRLSTIITLGSILAMLIAGLGLFGLAAISVARRTKEIGIRKTLGASTGHIVAIFGKEFSALVIVALIVSIPVGWFALNRWLETFAYRTEMGVLPFVVAGLSAFLLMWLAVSSQSLKAAWADPVEALRDE